MDGTLHVLINSAQKKKKNPSYWKGKSIGRSKIGFTIRYVIFLGACQLLGWMLYITGWPDKPQISTLRKKGNATFIQATVPNAMFTLLNLLVLVQSFTVPLLHYSEIRTPSGRVKSVPNYEVSSFQGGICTEDSSLVPDEVSLFHRMSLFRRAAIHRFHIIVLQQL
jgi:hypothetical protein